MEALGPASISAYLLQAATELNAQRERITELEAENAQLKAMQADDGELLTIAYMDGSHRSTKAHRAKIAQQDAVIAGLVEALHRISLGSQNSATSKEDLGRSARAALAKAKESRDA